MSRDFVKPQSKRAHSNPHQGLPGWIWIVSLLVITLFMALVLKLSGKEAATVEEKTKAVPVSAEAKAKARETARIIQKIQEPVPVPPEIKWTYHDELPKRTVEIPDVVPPDQQAKQAYMLHCASLKTEQAAQDYRERLNRLGVRSEIRVSTNDKGITWYKVILGPVQGKRNAEGQKHQMQAKGFEGCRIYLKTDK